MRYWNKTKKNISFSFSQRWISIGNEFRICAGCYESAVLKCAQRFREEWFHNAVNCSSFVVTCFICVFIKVLPCAGPIVLSVCWWSQLYILPLLWYTGKAAVVVWKIIRAISHAIHGQAFLTVAATELRKVYLAMKKKRKWFRSPTKNVITGGFSRIRKYALPRFEYFFIDWSVVVLRFPVF